jgi:two-component system, cell cycle sensor histidine kinase and response regulator CckA
MSKLKVLVVEDEPAVRRLCADLLCNAGYEPIVAADGVQGLQIYRERFQEIELIISDVVMPNKGGLEMTADVLRMRSDVNILLMSGYGIPDELPIQVSGVLPKPFAPKQLIEAVRKCLDRASVPVF